MLQNLREHVHGWIAGVIAGVICISFAFWGVESFLGASSQKPAATVNGIEIMQHALASAYDRLKQTEGLQLDDMVANEVMQKEIKARALDALIQQSVLLQSAEKAGYVISPVQVGHLLQQMPAFLKDGQFSYPTFQRVLYNLSYTSEAFLQEMNKSALLNQVEQSLQDSSFASIDDAKRAISLENEKRDIGYFLIDTQRFSSSVSVNPQAVEAYYKSNADLFKIPERISLQYIVLSAEEIAKKIKPTDQELHQYYQENKASFAVKNAATPDFEKIKPEVQKRYIQQKSEQMVAEESDKLANLSYAHPDTLKLAADAVALPIQTTPLFSREGLKNSILSNPKVLIAAFSDNVLKQRNNSDLISLDDHTAVVIRIADYQAPEPKPLAEVRPIIESTLKQNEAKKMAADLGERILGDLNKGISIQQLATQNKLLWVEKSNIDRKFSDKQVPSDIITSIFLQPVPKSVNQPQMYGKALTDGSYAVVAIHKALEGNADTDSAEQLKSMQTGLGNGFGTLDSELYMAYQLKIAKIDIPKEETKQ